MSNTLLARLPAPVKVGLPLAAAALTAAACSSSGSGSSGGGSTAGGNSAGSAAMTSSATVVAAPGSSSTFLTDNSGRSLYLFQADSMNKSNCSGACATAWPPLTTTGTPTGSGGVKAADLSTITLSSGKKQVTFDGHPLYLYAGDSGAKQTNGQGLDQFGAKWYLVAPTGKAITGADNAGAAPAGSGSSSSSSSSSSNSGGGSGAGGGWA